MDACAARGISLMSSSRNLPDLKRLLMVPPDCSRASQVPLRVIPSGNTRSRLYSHAEFGPTLTKSFLLYDSGRTPLAFAVASSNLGMTAIALISFAHPKRT